MATEKTDVVIVGMGAVGGVAAGGAVAASAEPPVASGAERLNHFMSSNLFW